MPPPPPNKPLPPIPGRHTPPNKPLPPIPGRHTPPNKALPPILGGVPQKPLPALPNGAAGINALTGYAQLMAQLFVAGPKAFMQTQSVTTGNQVALGGIVPTVVSTRMASSDLFRDQMDDVKLSHRRMGPIVRYLSIEAPLAGDSKSMLKLNSAPGPGLLPIYWLPWEAKAIMETTIPPIPTGGDVNDNDTYPKYFLTAGLSGCSIFVTGPRDNPTIRHAGLEIEKISGSSGRFWKDQMQAMNVGFDAAQLKGLIHKKSYLNGSEREAVQAYIRWLESGRTGTFKLEYHQGAGLVFGVREGRNWTFYLQESATIGVVRFVNRADVSESTEGGTSYKGYHFLDAAGKSQGVTETVTTTARKLGPITLPIFKKTTKTYSYNAETVSSPVRVVEIYPASYKATTSTTMTYSVS